MKAVVYEKYGPPDVVQIKDMEKPTPEDDQVLIKIHAASVNAYDWHFLTADVFLIRLMSGGIFKPKDSRLGTDVAGRIEAVGKNVKQFQRGDEVFGLVKGGFAEYAIAPENSLCMKPVNASFEEAAAIPMAAITALQGLRDEGQIQAGQKVLINGASGGVGTFAVQIAKSLGAEVTAVCSTGNLKQARSMGADQVIDYTRDDFTKNGELYDLILVANGNRSIQQYKRSLKPQGICVLTGGGRTSPVSLLTDLLQQWWISKTEGKKISSLMAKINQKDLRFMKDLFEAGKVKSVIDRQYLLSEIAEALGYLGEGHARGKVVITMEGSNLPFQGNRLTNPLIRLNQNLLII